MYKKIYSFLFSIILLTSCSVDNTLDGDLSIPQSNGDEVSFSFTVDIPLASSIISKANSAIKNGEELGIDDLVLYTFDATGFVEKVVPVEVSKNGDVTIYKTTVKKTIRKIHFLSNYTGEELYATTEVGASDERFYTLSTNEYVFWNVQTYANEEALAQIGANPIKMFRNWAKVSVFVEGKAVNKLSNVEFAIYNQSDYATMAAREEGKINVPDGNTYEPIAPVFAKVADNESLYSFENYADLAKNEGHQTYVIIKATYEGDTYYYKLDLSNERDEDKVRVVWDVIRNSWFQIKIQDVQREGVSSWEEAIDPENLPNNNISASSEIDAYPKISYKDNETQKLETLEVEKTTYIMTQSGGEFKSWAIYNISGGLPENEEIHIIDENVSEVFANGIDDPYIEDGKLIINATMATIGDTPKTGYFYVQAGNLQRKISVILRNPYQFINYKVTDASITESNKNNDITVHFEFPLTGANKVDESIFPLQCYIYSNVLYTVQDGIEIEILKDGGYRYVYLAKTPEGTNGNGHDIIFKLNKTESIVQTDNILLRADYFADASKELLVNIPEGVVATDTPKTGSIKYGNLSTGGTRNPMSNVPNGATVSSSSDKASVTVGNNGTYTITIKAGAKYNDLVTFTYRTGTGGWGNPYIYYYCTISIQQLLKGENIYLTNKGSHE